VTSVYERDGGRRQLRIVSDPALGVPYGHVARIWLIWISTRIVQKKQVHRPGAKPVSLLPIPGYSRKSR
jgi:hypothetical protein